MLDVCFQEALLLFWSWISARTEGIWLSGIMIVIAPFCLRGRLARAEEESDAGSEVEMIERGRGLRGKDKGGSAYKVICEFQARHVR